MNLTPEQINRWLLIGGILLAVVVIWRAVRSADKREEPPAPEPIEEEETEPPSGPSPTPSTGIEPGPEDSRENNPRFIRLKDGSWYELPLGSRPIQDWNGLEVYSLYPQLARDFVSIGVIQWDITGQNQALIEQGLQIPPLEEITMQASFRFVDQWLAENPNAPQVGTPASVPTEGLTRDYLDRNYAENIMDMIKGQYQATMNVSRLQNGVFGYSSQGDEALGPGSYLPEDFKRWYYGSYYTTGSYLQTPDPSPRLNYEQVGTDYSIMHLTFRDRMGLHFINADYYRYVYGSTNWIIRLAFLEASAIYNVLVQNFGAAFYNARQSTRERFQVLNQLFGDYWKPHAPIILEGGVKSGDHNLVSMWDCMGLHLPGMLGDYGQVDFSYACGYEG